MMNSLKVQIFAGGKKEPNITFLGLGGIGMTKAKFLEGTLELNVWNIRNFVDDGVDLKLHINKQFRLGAFGSLRGTPSTTQTLIGQNSKGIDDPNGLIYSIQNNTLYEVVNYCTFNFQGLKSIGAEGFRNVKKCTEFTAPLLENLILPDPIVFLGTQNGNIPLYADLSNLMGNAPLGSTLLTPTTLMPLVNGTVSCSLNTFLTFFPFPNASDFLGTGFRNCSNMEGAVQMLNATGSINMTRTLNGASKVTKLLLKNATKFINSQFAFSGASMLNEIDMRKVTEWTGTENGWGGVNLPNLTIRANEVLKTAGTGGTMHPWLLDAQNGGATIIWYDASGNPTDQSFITTWQTTVANESITIPTTGTGYNYNVDWGDGTITTGHTGNATHSYAVAGVYVVKIIPVVVGGFPRIYFNNGAMAVKLMSIEQWGSNVWGYDIRNSFFGCSNMVGNATDVPNLGAVSIVSAMFKNCSLYNPTNIGSWNTSNITLMIEMFIRCTAFNGDISGWNVGNVTSMLRMFQEATSFNRNLGGWNISNVTDMTNMFHLAGISTANYDTTLNGWSSRPVKTGVVFNAGSSKYTITGKTGRDILTGSPNNWSITDGGMV